MLILSDREHRSVMPRRNRNTISHGFADYLPANSRTFFALCTG